MNKNQKNKKILFTLLLTLTFVVGLIPLGIRGANADELTEPLEQMVISTTGEQLNDVEVSVPDEGESSEKDDQEIEVENSKVPEKEALEPDATKEEEKSDEVNIPLIQEKETPRKSNNEGPEETLSFEKEKPDVEETQSTKDNALYRKESYAIEDVPPIEEEPKIKIPFISSPRTTGLKDTIKVAKTAIRSSGCRTFEVTLKITGEPQVAPVDVVLVIDRSGSMNDHAAYEDGKSRSRLYYAKKAAINFASRVLSEIPGSRISVVSFNGPGFSNVVGSMDNSTINQGLTNDLSSVSTAIEAISASGGTNTEAGFLRAKQVIENSRRPESNKVVVMLTDGMPTGSNNAGAGPNDPTRHNSHTIAAYKAGQSIWPIADVFTLGLLQNMNASVKKIAIDTLTLAQNKGFYEAPTAQDFTKMLDAISQELAYSATNATVVDKIGENFDLVESSLPAGATYNSSKHEITWKPGTIYDSAELKYVVQAKPTFAGGLADTNEFAKLTYKDIFGTAGKTKDFPVPEVDVPTLIEISLTDAYINLGDSIFLGEGTNPAGENYMSPVTGGDNDGKTFKYEWRVVEKSGEKSDVISNEKNPSVKPSVETQYEVTVTDSNGCKAVAKMTVFPIAVTKVEATKKWVGGPSENQTAVQLDLYRKIENGQDTIVNEVTPKITGEAPTFNYTWENLPKTDKDGNEYIYSVKENGVDDDKVVIKIDKNKYEYIVTQEGNVITNTYEIPKIDVEATKKWVGGPSENQTAIQLDLYREVDGQDTIVNGGTPKITGEAPTFKYTWENLPKTDKDGNEYIYFVKENGITDGKVVIERDGKKYEYIVTQEGNVITNTYESPKINVKATKIWVGGFNEKPTIKLQLYRDDEEFGAPVTLKTEQPDSSSTHTWEGLDETDHTGKPYIYTVDEVEVPEYHVKTEDKDGLTLTNTHQTGILKVSKKVDGNLGDTSKFFEVVVRFILPEGKTLESPIKYTGGKYSSEKSVDGQQVTIEIKDGQTIEFTNVPYGVKYEVKEKDYYTSEKYKTDYEFLDVDQLMNSKEESVKITNTKQEVIDTGIALDSLPYIIILTLLVAAGIGRIMWKRKQTELD